jgi:methionyl-tRNA formyltransferase
VLVILNFNSSESTIRTYESFLAENSIIIDNNSTEEERIKIIKARKSNSIGNASTILNETFDIGCNDGSIEPLILQREGKNPISKDDFLRGYSFKVNEVINA